MVKLLKKRLEELTGNRITNEKLTKAVSIYNQTRELLKKIGESRKAGEVPISTLDFIKLNHASYYLDPIFINDALTSGLKKISGGGRKHTKYDRPRLLLTGPNVAYGDYKILELIEECGANVVAEEVLEGVRSYRENVATEGDLLESLAIKYLVNRLPAAFMRFATRERFNFIMKLAEEFKVHGIIWYQLLYCDTYDMESHFFVKNLEMMGLPMLKLESDYNVLDRGLLRTRIETFIETNKRRFIYAH
jgi:benzoyl-CoA reductase/2-hydroxyglutaryl-CoA dehydratase subunit BcrC/BadD/HgdB